MQRVNLSVLLFQQEVMISESVLKETDCLLFLMVSTKRSRAKSTFSTNRTSYIRDN